MRLFIPPNVQKFQEDRIDPINRFFFPPQTKGWFITAPGWKWLAILPGESIRYCPLTCLSPEKHVPLGGREAQTGRNNAISIDDTAECTSIGSRDNAYGIPRGSLHAVGENFYLAGTCAGNEAFQRGQRQSHGAATFLELYMYRTFREIISLIKVCLVGVSGINADV